MILKKQKNVLIKGIDVIETVCDLTNQAVSTYLSKVLKEHNDKHLTNDNTETTNEAEL